MLAQVVEVIDGSANFPGKIFSGFAFEVCSKFHDGSIRQLFTNVNRKYLPFKII